MAKQAPADVFRAAFKHLGDILTPDDLAVVLGAVVERQKASEELLWRYYKALVKVVGLEEQAHIAGRKYRKNSLVRKGDDIFVAKRPTSAPLENATDWLHLPDLPPAPAPASAGAVKKVTTVLSHDERGRIEKYETVEVREDEP